MVIMLTSVSSAIPPAFAIDPPRDLKPSGSTSTSITISWNAPPGTVTGYKIEAAQEGANHTFGAFTVLTANTGTTNTTFTHTGLSGEDAFLFRVTAIDGSVESVASANVFAGTLIAGESFSGKQDFSAGAQNFGTGSTFDAGQNFVGQDHNFGAEGMTFCTGSSFSGDRSFGENADFSAGAQVFSGQNVFKSGTKFASGQDFSGLGDVTSGTLVLFAGTYANIAALFVDIGPQVYSNILLTPFETDKISLLFTGLTSGDAAQEVQFTDSNDDGIITETELAAMTSVTVGSNGGTVTLIRYNLQDFTAGAQTFGTNMKFGNNQDFSGNTHTFGTGTELKGNAIFEPNQAFAQGMTFGDEQEFNSSHDFNFDFSGMTYGGSGGIDFGKARTFGATADFSAGTQVFVGSNVFKAGTTFAVGQDFSTLVTQDFTGQTNTFANDMKFAANEDFSDFASTFGDGITFKGNTLFHASQEFGEGAFFDTTQTFGSCNSCDFTALDIQYGTTSSMAFGKVITFGAGAIFPENQDFRDHAHTVTATDMIFKVGSLFPTGGDEYTFGQDANFQGVIAFPSAQDFTVGAEFFNGQTFSASNNPDFADFGTFNGAPVFGGAEDFKSSPYFKGVPDFDAGSQYTFAGNTKFDSAIDFKGEEVFSGPADFAANTTFDTVQTFQSGSQFGSGVTFANSQVLPVGTITSAGILTEAITCLGGDNCLDEIAGKVLAKAALSPSGTTHAAVKNNISNDSKVVTVDGLGVKLTLDTVSTRGGLDVTVKDPDDVVTDTGAELSGTDGALSMTADGTDITTISSVIDFTLADSAAISGSMTIEMPYDEAAATAKGFDENNLKVVHYTGGEWITEDDCTVDKVNDIITCTVTSLSPYSVGGSASSGGTASDTTIPTFTTDLEINGVELVENSGETITVTAGEPTNIGISATDNFGAQNITHLDIYYNHDGNKILNNLKESYITFENEELFSTDPNSILDSVTMLTLLVDDFKKFTFDVVFGKSFDTSDVLVRAWDLSGNSNSLYYEDALKVVSSDTVPTSESAEPTPTSESTAPASESAEPSFIDVFDQWAGYSSTSVSDSDFLNQLGIDGDHIPKWYKQNNAKWFKDGLISQTVFVAGLDDLNTRGILKV